MSEFLGYARVSRVGDRAKTLISPELQAERIQSYAAARGVQVRMLDPELDVSGGKVERPILSAAIETVERGEAGGLIVAQLDRLSRMDIADALHVIRRIESAGAQVIAVAENFDAGTPEGRMSRNVFLAMGEMQLDRYKAQFRVAKEQAVRRGIWPMPIVPLGYEKGPDRKLRPGKDAPKVVRAFEQRAGGASWAAIADALGKGLTGARKIVTNRVYLGEIHLGDWHNLEAHGPIVSRSLWESAQRRYPPPPRGEKRPQALLAGKLRCAACGFTMSADSNLYKCRPHKAGGKCPAPAIVSRPRVEQFAREAVLQHLSVHVGAMSRTDGVEKAQGQLEAAEAELTMYQQATAVSEVGVEHFREGMRRRVEAVDAAKGELERAREDAPAPDGDFRLDDEATRHVIRGAVGAVCVWKGRPADLCIVAAGMESEKGSPEEPFPGPPKLDAETEAGALAAGATRALSDHLRVARPEFAWEVDVQPRARPGRAGRDSAATWGSATVAPVIMEDMAGSLSEGGEG